MSVWSGLEPKGVWKYFEELCRIPHGSHKEKEISDYCMAFAKKRGLEAYQDALWNVILIKEASAGYESAEPLILQGHLDMVCEKKADCAIDFEKDGLCPAVDGDYVYAEGTTLGGDDGIAIAYALAILDDDSIPHPRLEAVFTTCEEVGMDGAHALDVSILKGHTVLNLDSEEEGVLLAGCAGGVSARITFPINRAVGEGICVSVTIGGLLGGHSGVEIDKGRGNACLLLARLLTGLAEKTPYQAIRLDGGRKDNAIPRESRAELLMSAADVAEAQKFCEEYEAVLKNEYSSTDSSVTVRIEIQGGKKAEVMDAASFEHALMLLLSLPCGIQTMSGNIEGLVETSLNLGIMKTMEREFLLRYAVRSSVGTAKDSLTQKMGRIVKFCGGKFRLEGAYPAWEYRKDSPLRERMVSVYKQMFGANPEVKAIHAGLECGVLASKIENLDCVSMGPDILDIHTTEEKMSISSVERMWRYILEIIRGSAK